MKKLIDWISNIVLIFTIIIAVFYVLSIIQTRQNPDQTPKILGYTPLTVLSDSMNPAIKTGDLIIISDKVDDLKVGDVITYDTGNIIVTHRIIEVTADNNQIAYVTKGDANNAADTKPVFSEQILGKYKLRIPYAGYIQSGAKGWLGLVLFMGLLTLYFIRMAIREIKSQLKKPQGSSQ